MANKKQYSVDYQQESENAFPPAHTTEHLLNQTMVRLFGCERCSQAQIERKKSTMSFVLDHKPSRQEEKEITKRMNELIDDDLPVTTELVDIENLPEDIAASDRWGGDALSNQWDGDDPVRLVRIGDYDVWPCLGKHVRSTSQIGYFEVINTSWDEHRRLFTIRFKVVC